MFTRMKVGRSKRGGKPWERMKPRDTPVCRLGYIFPRAAVNWAAHLWRALGGQNRRHGHASGTAAGRNVRGSCCAWRAVLRCATLCALCLPRTPTRSAARTT